jgi:hypothetical protein
VLNKPQRASWLTSKRLRAHGLILAACLWTIYAWNLSTPGLRDRAGNLKGTDFLHFYTLGSLALEHRGTDLYDMNAQSALAAQRVPEAEGIRYLPLYPPQVSLLFAPFALFSYAWALALWWGCCAAIYGLCCYAIWRACPNLQDSGGIVAILAIAYPAFFHLIAWGQTSAIALACFTVAFFQLRAKREFAAGLALGCLVFKPQLGLAAAIVFVSIVITSSVIASSGTWKVLAGALISAVAQLSIGVFYYGPEPLRRWLGVLGNVQSVLPLLEPRPYQTHCLRTFWAMLLPWHGVGLTLYVVSAIVVLALTVAVWRRRSAPLSLRYSSLLFATVLVAPHLTVYDLVILAPAFLLAADWLRRQDSKRSASALEILLYMTYILPLVGPLARWTHVQLPVIAMVGVTYLIWRSSVKGDVLPSSESNADPVSALQTGDR